MIWSLLNSIISIFTWMKGNTLGDIGWDSLFLMSIMLVLVLYMAKFVFTIHYNREETRVKLMGAGRAADGAYRLWNWGLRTAYSTSFIFLFMSGVTAGSVRNGHVADLGSPMTNIQTRTLQIRQNCGKEGSKDVLYCRTVVDAVGGSLIVDTIGIAVKTGPDETAPGTNLEAGSYIKLSLSEGHSWISSTNEEQIVRAVAKSKEGFWAKLTSKFKAAPKGEVAAASSIGM